jgi:hypothetical protein
MKKILKLGFLIAFLSIFIVGCNKHEVKPYDYTAFKKSKHLSFALTIATEERTKYFCPNSSISTYNTASAPVCSLIFNP